MQADTRNPANVVVKRALALILHGDLLMKGLVNVLKAGDRQYGFIYNGRLTPFFSQCKELKMNNGKQIMEFLQI